MQKHLDWNTLERVMRGETEPRQVIRDLLRHLLEVCPDCRRTWRSIALPQRVTAFDALLRLGYGATIERSIGELEVRVTDLEEERRRAPELAAELVERVDEGAEELIREPRFHTWGVCDLLINESAEAAFEDPAAAEALATLALAVASRLDRRRYGPRFVEDVQALGWAYLANARRVRFDLIGAEQALERAWSQVERGTGDPLCEAQVANLEASLRRAQRRFDESIRLSDRVAVIYRQTGDPYLEGRALVKKAYTLREAGHVERAIPTLREAIERIDPDKDPRLELCARHNLIYCLIDTGRAADAEVLLDELRPVYGRFPDFSTRLRLTWIEGKLAAARGRVDEAEAAFWETRDGFVAEGIGFDAALVSLDLAALYARAARTQDVKRLAGEMFAIFQAHDIHREAIAALVVFQQAAVAEAVTETMVEELAAFLRAARRDRGLRYESPS